MIHRAKGLDQAGQRLVDADRVFGLDAVRALAIVLVVKAHGNALLGEFIPFAPVVPRVDYVDLFFALSGYLIGGLLLRTEASSENERRWRMLHFWQRRWLRTLPNYYLFLLLNIALVLLAWTPGVINHNVFAYFVFFQNLYKSLDLFFVESWSLVVEVWFYTIFPLLVFGFARVLQLPFRAAFLSAVVVLIVAPACLRLFVIDGPGIETMAEWDAMVRRLAITRMDTIGFGALAVWLNVAERRWWQRWRWPLFVLGGSIVLWAANFRTVMHLPFLSTWFFSLTAFAMALLLPAMATWRTKAAWSRPVVFLSQVAYAWYLTHVPVRSLFLSLVPGLSPVMTGAVYCAYYLVSLLLAFVVYRYYEKPFMDMRDRLGLRFSVKAATPSS